MKEITKAYKCDHCGRILATKAGMSRHEKCCPKNPANISMCKECMFLEHERKVVYDGHVETTFHCTKKNINLYHPKVLRMSDWIRKEIIYGAEMMPTIDKGCNDYKFSYDKMFEQYKKE